MIDEREYMADLLYEAQYRHMSVEDTVDLLQDLGVICPSCKIGDVVYFVLNDGTIQGRMVDEIVLDKNGLHIWAGIAMAEQNEFGQSVFLTREEAEQAVKERSNSG